LGQGYAAKPRDIHVGATLVVALGRHKACPYSVGTTSGMGEVGDAGDVRVGQVEGEKTDRHESRKLHGPVFGVTRLQSAGERAMLRSAERRPVPHVPECTNGASH
jgi:hypothetical protein